MNLKPYLTTVRLMAALAAVLGFALLVSFIAGQCRKWATPKPFPPLVDAGSPIAGPSSEAPTVQDAPLISRPDLTLDELKDAAAKYGFEVSKPAVSRRQQNDTSADVSPQLLPQVAAKDEARFPMFLGEERFIHAPSGVSVDVAAWLAGFGERVDLRARFAEWKPPAKQAIPVCQSGGFFENVAKWEKELGAGVVYGNGQAGLGGWGSVAYRGPRTGAITWGARGTAAYSPQSGAVGFGGASVSW